jgi:uncharacterized protein YndB with AHSA1/START domain
MTTTQRARFEHTGRRIEDEMRIGAPPEQVYGAWSDPDLLTSWFIGRMEGRMEEGETVTWLFDDSGPGMSQTIVLAEPPHRLVTRMDLPQGPSFLEVTIEPDGEGSVVRLVQSGFGEGPEWDDQYEGMLSGWMIALAILKIFVERYFGRDRREIVVLADAAFDRADAVNLQRTEDGLARWLTRSGEPGEEVGDPVRLVLEDGTTLTGRVLRNTPQETVWSWDEKEGVLEIKAFRGAGWGSKVGVRISSWLEDLSELADLEEWLTSVVERLAGALTGDGS